MTTCHPLHQRLLKLKNPQKAAQLSRFFKTRPGEYGEHDRFLGIYVADLRRLSNEFKSLPLDEIELLLVSGFNEERLCGLLILRHQFEKAGPGVQQEIVDFYLDYLDRVNNWNLVDVSAPYILGEFVYQHPSDILDSLSRSPQMWHRRVAVVATLALIRKHQFDPTLRIAERLLEEPEDLIHKAMGWMLREIGKRDRDALISFLNKFCPQMPRIMLRYALEHFEKEERQAFLKRR